MISNFSFLSITQILNIFIPLMTYPFLIRVVGNDKYGLVIYAQTIITYLAILISFGFNITAVREISIFRDDKEKINQIFSSVILIKLILFIFSLFILGFLLTFLPFAKGYEFLYLISMWACLSEIIFPLWYFQGVQQVKYITYITLINRLLFLVSIFLFVKSPTDYLKIPLINAICTIISGGISIYIILVKHQIKFNFQPLTILNKYFKEALSVFISDISMMVYLNTNKVIVGSYLGLTNLSYYDLAEKIISILKMPQSMLSQAIFPKVSHEKNMDLVKKVFKYSIYFHIVLMILIYQFSEKIVLLLGGVKMLQAVTIIKVLVFSLPIVIMSNIIGILILLPLGYKNEYNRVIISSGFFYFILILITKMTFGLSIFSIPVINLITEIFVTSYMIYYLIKLSSWRKNMTI